MIGNSVHSIFKAFINRDNKSGWVLATLVKKMGSGYRDCGAMMLVSPEGERLGLISGGCLEKDLVQQAHRVSVTQQSKIVEYDSLEDAYESGLFDTGCEGKLFVYLTPVTPAYEALLAAAVDELDKKNACLFVQSYCDDNTEQEICLISSVNSVLYQTDNVVASEILESASFSKTLLSPNKNIFIVGAGPDALPLCRMAADLGWSVTLWDDRYQFIDAVQENSADRIDRRSFESIVDFSFLKKMDAVILKTHNLKRDTQWLNYIKENNDEIDYIGLLGAKKRRDKIMLTIDSEDQPWYEGRLFSPAGFDIGGDCPESIALSILSQCHSVLYGK